MLTDAPPRKNRSGFLASDRIKTLDLPRNGELTEIAQRLESAMKADRIRDVRSAYTAFLETASKFYEVPRCGVRVLAARPLRTREHGTFELFGDYTPESMQIRVWMRTAVRKEVTSFGTLMSTLCHEFCHHLDFKKFGFHDSWHTRGFSERLRFTIMRGERRLKNYSGCQRREDGGASTGSARIARHHGSFRWKIEG